MFQGFYLDIKKVVFKVKLFSEARIRHKVFFFKVVLSFGSSNIGGSGDCPTRIMCGRIAFLKI